MHIATFHTYFGAQCFYERLIASGDRTAAKIPVPRTLSVSCGTGVSFEGPFDPARHPDEDTECVYIAAGGVYTRIFDNA